MKKVMTIILTFVMTFLSTAVAENSVQLYCGSWFFAREMKGPYYSFELMHLFEDGTAYYFSNIIDSGKVDEDPVELLTKWEATEEGIRIRFNGGYQKYYLLEDGRLSDGSSFAPSVFDKVFPDVDIGIQKSSTQAPLNSLETGFLLDPGQYIVGEDLPAGGYRFEFYRDSCIITVREKPTDVLNSDYAYISNESPVYAKLILREGCLLEIESSPVIIMHAKPLNFGE